MEVKLSNVFLFQDSEFNKKNGEDMNRNRVQDIGFEGNIFAVLVNSFKVDYFRLLPVVVSLFLFVSALSAKEVAEIRILSIADIQYADKATSGSRFYRNSIAKLQQIREEVKDEKIDFVIHLGDIIDTKYSNLAAPMAELKNFPYKQYFVMGNHDFDDSAENVEKIRLEFGLEDSLYYYFDIEGWRFIGVDTNRLSTYFKPKDEALHSLALKLHKEIKDSGGNWGRTWNGGVDKAQLEWLDELLKKSEVEDKKVILFAHGPLRPVNGHICLNANEIVDLLSKYKCVKAWVNGHNHRGGYAKESGVHYLTVSGLIETEKIVSYAILELYADRIEVIGHGQTPSRTLTIK